MAKEKLTEYSAKRSFKLDVAFQSDSKRIVILGPSGAGKSLALKAIAGLLRPDAGHIRINGAPLFDRAARIDVPARARQAGYVFQDYALLPHLNVRQNVGFGLQDGLRNPSAHGHMPAVDAWLARDR